MNEAPELSKSNSVNADRVDYFINDDSLNEAPEINFASAQTMHRDQFWKKPESISGNENPESNKIPGLETELQSQSQSDQPPPKVVHFHKHLHIHLPKGRSNRRYIHKLREKPKSDMRRVIYPVEINSADVNPETSTLFANADQQEQQTVQAASESATYELNTDDEDYNPDKASGPQID